jgi:hypothetical protein
VAREHHIQDHQVEFLLVNEIEAFFPGVRHADFVVVLLEALPQGGRHLLFIFHYQDSHNAFLFQHPRGAAIKSNAAPEGRLQKEFRKSSVDRAIAGGKNETSAFVCPQECGRGKGCHPARPRRLPFM